MSQLLIYLLPFQLCHFVDVVVNFIDLHHHNFDSYHHNEKVTILLHTCQLRSRFLLVWFRFFVLKFTCKEEPEDANNFRKSFGDILNFEFHCPYYILFNK